MNAFGNLHFEKVKESVTVSIGAVLRQRGENPGFDKMYQKADELLYKCKRRVGNAYIVSGINS